jgi:hypothetical protein
MAEKDQDMKGGYPLPHPKTYDEDARVSIISKLSDLAEATIFTADDLALSDLEKETFYSLLGHDYVFLYDRHFTQIIETPYLRRLPAVPLLIEQLESHLGVTLRETGDRTAWKLGLKKWEPIKGYRYYTTGEELTVSLGMKKIKLLAPPNDLPELSSVSDFELSIYDTFREKESRGEILEWCKFNQDAKQRFIEVADIRTSRGLVESEKDSEHPPSDEMLEFVRQIIATLSKK